MRRMNTFMSLVKQLFNTSILTVLLASCLLGCTFNSSRPIDTVPVPAVKYDLAVMDMYVPIEYSREPNIIDGWWFGSETVYRNGNAGSMLADYISTQFEKIPSVELFSRDRITTYLLGKRQLLMSSFPGLTDAEYTDMLTKISPLDYGRDLGVDQVLTGRILRSETRRHNTLEIWHSIVEVEVELWDVNTGQMVWSHIFKKKDRFESQPQVMLFIAKQVAEEINESFFGLQDKALGRKRPSRPDIDNSVR